ncbi:MAG: transcriptional regulator [Candidatus Korarchaeota archaeon]|nr:transcriptional regulator [Candidatus Korarchaeota archaeon]
MERDQLVGALLLILSVLVILIYGYLVFFYDEAIAILVLKLTGFVAVLGVFGVLGWIGYTLATTPPPKPIEEIEKELEEELKKLEEEKKENEHSEGT